MFRRNAFGQLVPYRSPRLMFDNEPDPNAGGGGDQTPKLNENGFPDSTAVADMKPEHAIAYWKHQSRKHEANRKPADYDQVQADAAAFRAAQEAGKPPEQQALDAARREGEQNARSTLLVDAVTAFLRAGAPNLTQEEADEIVEDLNLTKFTTQDGRLDRERVANLAKKHAATASTTPPNLAGQQQVADPLAQALGTHGNPGASGSGGGSISALRKQRAEALTTNRKS